MEPPAATGPEPLAAPELPAAAAAADQRDESESGDSSTHEQDLADNAEKPAAVVEEPLAAVDANASGVPEPLPAAAPEAEHFSEEESSAEYSPSKARGFRLHVRVSRIRA